MRTLALATLALPLLFMGGCAEVSVVPVASSVAAPAGLSIGPRAAVAIGRGGMDPNRRCSTENPNIEYRDCVNASTRDPNVKVRLG